MNILIVNGYTRQNKGDAALLSVLCQELQASFPNASLKISSKEDPAIDTHFEAWQNIGSLIQYCFLDPASRTDRLARLVLSIFAVSSLSCTPKNFHKAILRILPRALRLQLTALLEADLVVSMGGGYLNGSESLRAQGIIAIKTEQAMANASLYLMLAPLRLAKRAGACVVCAPQSMGPFPTRFQKILVTRTLEKTDLVLTREKKTIKILTELSKRFPIVSSVDSGFLFKTDDTTANLRDRLGIAQQDLLVGVTVRRWLDPKRQRDYEQAIAQAIDHLTDRYKATVVFIPQVTSPVGDDDDRTTAGEVYAKVKHKDPVHLLDGQYTHQQIKALYDDLDIIIGTRFHSVIFSLTSHVPALAIEYEHKTSGIMHDLGLDAWVVKIEDATPKVLAHKIDELIAEKGQYKRHLAKTLPPYIARAQKAITFIKQAYEHSASLNP